MKPEDFSLAITRTNQRETVFAYGGTRANMFTAPWRSIRRIDGYNVREGTDPGYADHLAMLTKSVIANGYLADKPMVGYTGMHDGVPTILLLDGYSRLTAVERAAAAGTDVERVSIIILPNEATWRQMTVALAMGNAGRQLTPLGLGIVCKRLEADGMTAKEIAEQLTITTRYVNDLRLLIGAPASVRDLVATGKVAATQAIEQLRQDQATASDRLEAGVAIAMAAGKDKATAKHIKAAAAPLIVPQEPPAASGRPSDQHKDSAWPFPADRHPALPADTRTGELLQGGEAATKLEKSNTDPGPVTTPRSGGSVADRDMLAWLAAFFARKDCATIEREGNHVYILYRTTSGTRTIIADAGTVEAAIEQAMVFVPYSALGAHPAATISAGRP